MGYQEPYDSWDAKPPRWGILDKDYFEELARERMPVKSGWVLTATGRFWLPPEFPQPSKRGPYESMSSI